MEDENVLSGYPTPSASEIDVGLYKALVLSKPSIFFVANLSTMMAMKQTSGPPSNFSERALSVEQVCG